MTDTSRRSKSGDDRLLGTRAKKTSSAASSSSWAKRRGGQSAASGSRGGGVGDPPRCRVERVLRVPNTLVVLHLSPNAPVLTLDLCCHPPHAPAELVVKGFVREASEPAAKTLDRMRLLFAPKATNMSTTVTNTSLTSHGDSRSTRPGRRDGASQPPLSRASFLSKDAQLARCPAVVVRGVAPEGDARRSSTDEQEDDWVTLDASMANGLFWSRARVLHVGEVRVQVRYNVPTIVHLTPPSPPFVDVPLVCSDIETAFTAHAEVEYAWYARPPAAAAAASVYGSAPVDRLPDEDGWTLCATTAAFVPPPELLDHTLVLRVRADASTEVWTQVELPAVEQPPPAVGRWGETLCYAVAPAMRVTTYNILHDDFCTSRASREKLYPFASEAILSMRHRQVRIVQELLAYHSDVVCLQECGKKLFHGYLLPTLRVCGYEGVYANKTGHVQEGCGFFFRTARLACCASHTIALNWQTLRDQHAALAASMSAHAELVEALTQVTSIATVHVMRDRVSEREFVVGNTHLFYHPHACHIRVLQLYMMLHAIHRIAAGGEVSTAVEDKDAALRPIILCGDFNFTHPTGAYQLATQGRVECGHHSWEKGKRFWWGCDRLLGSSESDVAAKNEVNRTTPPAEQATPMNASEAVGEREKGGLEREGGDGVPRRLETCFGADLQSPLRLTDAYGLMDPTLPWTNYAMAFREVIDYIFVSTANVRVLRTIPIPPESELAANFALPNANYPSDHVALVADVAIDIDPSECTRAHTCAPD